MSKCRGCGAEIIWIETPGGKNHPIDMKPKKMWVEIYDDETESLIWRLRDCYESHFSTCPDAKEFRKTAL